VASFGNCSPIENRAATGSVHVCLARNKVSSDYARALARRFSGKIKFTSARGTRKNALARSLHGSRADTGRREGEENRAAEIEPSTKPAAGFGDERLRTSPAALD